MSVTNVELQKALKSIFGFNAFKGKQEQIISSIMDNHDTFVIMPTGGGKSLCYQLPALLKEGTAIVISPLIALMKNQVDVIRGISGTDKIAHVLNSSLTKGEIRTVMEDIRSGDTKLLYVAPESLTKDEYIAFFKTIKISFVAVDEAHCISEWGHDFRPEYRNIKTIIDRLGEDIPIIALTATATTKVQEDILKNLGIAQANVFKSSFNRPNLYYEVRPKTKNINSDIIRFIKQYERKSGIIYCLSRKSVEELAQTLQVNGITAIPYHAGLDAKTRAKHQDMFLMEEVEVVVATIAFGMGIDKPDVRFVIHYDIPKSIESYYQETGRAGRDGGEGYCLAFYCYKDIEKLEKFMVGKPIAEQEIGQALLQDMVAYAETSSSRRKFILHYFGEEFDEINGEGANMDDNMRYPKAKKEAQEEVKLLLEIIEKTRQKLKAKDLVNVLTGKYSSMIKSNRFDEQDFFGAGKDFDSRYWMALIRQVMVNGYIRKDIETYGIMFLTDKGLDFLKNPHSFMMTEDHNFEEEAIEEPAKQNVSILDETLLNLLRDLRKKVAKQFEVPPFVVFQDASLEDMSMKYPINITELTNVFGVGEGKAKKYGKEFVELISRYVEENDIFRPEDLIVKTTGANSAIKLFIIQNIDKKLPLPDIAKAKGLSMDELLKEMEQIVYSGTKLNINYWVDEILDEEQQEELHDYFLEAETDKIAVASKEFGGDYEDDELRLYRIKFISEVGN